MSSDDLDELDWPVPRNELRVASINVMLQPFQGRVEDVWEEVRGRVADALSVVIPSWLDTEGGSWSDLAEALLGELQADDG